MKIQNILISLALFLSGTFYHITLSGDPSKVIEEKEYFVAEICHEPVEKTKTYQAIVRIQSRRMPKSEKAIAYFSKENFDTTLVAGDQLFIYAQPRQIKNSGNPFDFDYKAMMQNKGIYSSIYLPPGTFQKTGVRVSRFIYHAEHTREKLTGFLSQTKIGNKERAVVSALALGHRTELDSETMDYFADTGTIHVLSVSGLHVAMIYFILSLLFSSINKGKIGSVVYPLLMILFLWAYAFVTGFSPSVQRSTVMFSFVIIGSILRRPVNIYNSLAASALVLVLLDPKVLFDIGFQLSYLAVFGIVLIQPPMEALLQVKNKILKWAWTLFTVSIAAQLATFPLSVMYFHQFPNLFWLSNFIAIPATTIIIWLTIGFFVFYPFALLTDLMGELIHLITHWMLVILKWISTVPHAVSEGIVYNPLQTCILYGLIAAGIIYCFSKRKTWLFGTLILLIAFQASMLWARFNLFNQKIVFVYSVKEGLVHCINGRNNYIIMKNHVAFNKHESQMIQNVCEHLKLKKPMVIHMTKFDTINFNDLKISDSTMRFLNCNINLTDRLNLSIQNTDVKRFERINNELFKKNASKIHFTQKDSFSIDFTGQFNEAVCIFLY